MATTKKTTKKATVKKSSTKPAKKAFTSPKKAVPKAQKPSEPEKNIEFLAVDSDGVLGRYVEPLELETLEETENTEGISVLYARTGDIVLGVNIIHGKTLGQDEFLDDLLAAIEEVINDYLYEADPGAYGDTPEEKCLVPTCPFCYPTSTSLKDSDDDTPEDEPADDDKPGCTPTLTTWQRFKAWLLGKG